MGTSDLHSGSVTAAILASNAVTGAKVAGDSLTGSDVKESTLGIVPDSGSLGGLAPSAFLHSSNAARIDFVPSGCDVSTDACAADVLTLGGFTLHADCFNQNPNSDATLTLNANGPVRSSADTAYVVRPSTAVEHHAEQQGQIFTTTASGTEIPVDSAGTIVFQDHAGQTTVTVEFATHVIEHNTHLASCEVKGTALTMTG